MSKKHAAVLACTLKLAVFFLCYLFFININSMATFVKCLLSVSLSSSLNVICTKPTLWCYKACSAHNLSEPFLISEQCRLSQEYIHNRVLVGSLFGALLVTDLSSPPVCVWGRCRAALLLELLQVLRGLIRGVTPPL